MDRRSLRGYPLIFSYLGLFSMLIGIILLIPLIMVVFYPHEINQVQYFLPPAFVLILFGFISKILYAKYDKERLERHQDAILVVLLWILAIFGAAIPFILTGEFNLSQAVFESSSGFSTTGLTVVDVTRASRVFLFYRSVLQFVGGAGLVLVLTATISDKFGMRMYNAEGHGDKLMPNLIRSGRYILAIYLGYVIVGTILYIIFGMHWFDALNHAICAVATGGFSTKAQSIGYYQSLPIEITTIFLMFAGGTNFFVHLLVITGKWKSAFKHIETKSFYIITALAVSISTLSLISYYHGSFGTALRYGAFHFISAVTGTGYQIIPSFTGLPSFYFGLLIVGMILGAGVGSTCGGIKQYRVGLGIKSIYWSFADKIAHHKVIKKHFINKLGSKMIVDDDDISENYSFILVYLIFLMIGALIFSLVSQASMQNALFEFASVLGTVGLSVGITGYDAHPIILWTSSVGMFLGRLEFYVFFVAISKLFIDSKRSIKHLLQKA
jgi:trk system potassium uptake protein TrkH